MIGIQLDGDTEFLETVADTAIELTLNNPLLGDAENLSPGSYSMPFKLPAADDSPKNEEKLKHPGVIENNEAFQIQKASLFFDGVPFKKGNLKVNATDAKSLDTYFMFGLSSLDPKIKTARLRDVMNESVVIDGTSFQKIIYFTFIGDPPGSPVTRNLTVNGKVYSWVDLTDLLTSINTDNLNQGKFLPYVTYHVGIIPVGSYPYSTSYLTIKSGKLTGTLVSPTIEDNPDPLAELSVRLDESEDLANWFIQTNDFSSYYSAFNTYLSGFISGSFPHNKFRFPVFFNANLYDGDESTKKESEIINGVNSSGLILNDILKQKNYNSIQPFLILKYVIDKIAAGFNFSCEGDFYENSEISKILIDNSVTLDQPMELIGETKFAFWRRSFNLSELVPDISVVEFFKGISSRYNLGIYFNEVSQKVRFKHRENIAKQNGYEDITSLSSAINNIEDKRVTGYSLLSKKDESDKLNVSDELYTVGTPQETIEITCGRLWSTKTQVTDGVLFGPRVWRKNNDQGFKLRVFHYLGTTLTGNLTTGFFNYEAADIHGRDITGITFCEALADTESAPGIYSRYYQYWLLFKKNWRLITINVNWPLRQLLKFDFELKRRFDRNNYLVDSIKVTMNNKGVQVSEVTVYTMK